MNFGDVNFGDAPGAGVIGLAAALGVGMIFVHSGTAKLRHRAIMPGIVANYRLLPDALVSPFAAGLPIAEVVLGLALLAGGWRAAVAPAALLLVIFAAAMAINIGRGRRHIDCGCGSSDLRQPLSWLLVSRNLVLAAILLVRLLPAPVAGPLDVIVASFGGISLFLVMLLFNAVGALRASPLALTRS